jgi:hypothetical protein
MHEHMMNLMTTVMNRFPEGGSGISMVAPSLDSFAANVDHSRAGGGGGSDTNDHDSDKEN